jgi:two-component system CheB/CheR fusion protein
MLHETEQKLQSVTHELSELRRGLDEAVIVSISNLKGEIIYANPMMCKVTGYSMEEVIGKNHRMFKSGHHPRSFFRDLWETVVCGKVWKGEIMNKRKDGSYFWVDTTIVPFVNSDGRPYQFMSFRKDITERKLAEERANKERATREYAGRLAAIGEMAAYIAHEIRNPLAAILLRTQLTKRSDGGNELHSSLDQIERLAHRIEKIIDGVHLFSRDGGNDPFESVNLSRLVRETLEMINDRFEKEGIQLIVDSVPTGVQVNGRPAQLSQVLLNLVANAFDAAQAQEKKWVRLSIRQTHDCVRISVSDSGTGIDSELASQIMRPYFTTKAVGKGTGLGLSISKRIAEEHGGSLTIDTEAENTTFIVTLPIIENQKSRKVNQRFTSAR